MEDLNPTRLSKVFGPNGHIQKQIMAKLDCWQTVCDLCLDYVKENKTYHDITGNLFKSTGAVVRRNGALVVHRAMPGKQPIYEPLDKGEAMNPKFAPNYYDGKPNTGYEGETQLEDYRTGPERRAAMYKSAGKGFTGGSTGYGLNYSVTVFAAMSYADYVERKSHRTVLGNLGSEMKDIFMKAIKSNNYKAKTWGT